jgi:uncharacterized membrane protein
MAVWPDYNKVNYLWIALVFLLTQVILYLLYLIGTKTESSTEFVQTFVTVLILLLVGTFLSLGFIAILV